MRGKKAGRESSSAVFYTEYKPINALSKATHKLQISPRPPIFNS